MLGIPLEPCGLAQVSPAPHFGDVRSAGELSAAGSFGPLVVGDLMQDGGVEELDHAGSRSSGKAPLSKRAISRMAPIGSDQRRMMAGRLWWYTRASLAA